jgi:Flp pilus assembly protein TadD
VEDFVRTNWWHHGATVALGRLYTQRGDVDLADAALRRASWLDVHDAEALGLIVQMRLRQNKLDEACRIQRRAVARQPDEPRQYVLLSDILERMGRSNEAHAVLAEATRLRDLVQKSVAAN